MILLGKAMNLSILQKLIMAGLIGTVPWNYVSLDIIDGHSMQPILKPNDFLLSYKASLFPVCEKELVIFQHPLEVNVRVIKQVSGLEGDVRKKRFGEREVIPKGHFWASSTNEVMCVDSRIYGPRSYLDSSIDGSYVRKVLSVNEVSITTQNSPFITFESNHLPANLPTEDRRFYGDVKTSSDSRGTVCFGVVDGHAGHKCAQAVSERLRSYLAVASCEDATLLPKLTPDSRLGSRVILPGDYVTADQQERNMHSLRQFAEVRAKAIAAKSQKGTEHKIQDEHIVAAFETLDQHLIDEALNSIGNKLDRVDIHAVESALSGACCVTAFIDEQNITCANVGDSRVVLGHQSVDGEWLAIPLTNEHNAENEAERRRLLRAHPAEDSNVILQHGRLFGSLLPLRAFGDMFFKVTRDQMQNLAKVFDIGKLKSRSLTPPYLSVTPEITRRKLEEGDKFLIMATDGLWDFIDPETAVDVIAHHLESLQQSTQSTHDDHCIHSQEVVRDLAQNGATRLIMHAIGQASSSHSLPLLSHLNDMIRLPPEYTRENRDDIQVIVVYFN